MCVCVCFDLFAFMCDRQELQGSGPQMRLRDADRHTQYASVASALAFRFRVIELSETGCSKLARVSMWSSISL